MKMTDCTKCFASKTNGYIIDVLHPNTGRTFLNDKTLEQCQKADPDAVEMSIGAWCEWKAAQQRTPIIWEKTTQEQFDEMLCILPPALMLNGGFLVGEPTDHDAGSGRPRFQAYRENDGGYEVASRPLTVPEFRKEAQPCPTK